MLGNYEEEFQEFIMAFQFYQLKISGSIGLKIAHHAPGAIINPGEVKEYDEIQEAHQLLSLSRRYFRDQKMTMLNMSSCMYTYSSDNDLSLIASNR